MNEISAVYSINEKTVNYNVKAERISFGDERTLYLEDKPPSYFSDWKEQGYTVRKFISEENIKLFNEKIKHVVMNYLKDIVDIKEFELDKYHNFVTDEIHIELIKRINAGPDGKNGIPFNFLPFPVELIEEHISKICGCNVTCKETLQGDKINNFWIRVVRPLSRDNNPPHRDIHLERSKGAINLYFPIAGSNLNSSLPVIPGSHLWPESEIIRTFGDTYINNIKFTNPATVSALKGLKMITPNPAFNEVLVFTPYMLHGGGRNFNHNLTRFSLEMRFWKKNDKNN